MSEERKETEIIELGPDDAALVIKTQGDDGPSVLSYYIKQEEESETNPANMLIAYIGLRLANGGDAFMEEVYTYMNEMFASETEGETPS